MHFTNGCVLQYAARNGTCNFFFFCAFLFKLVALMQHMLTCGMMYVSAPQQSEWAIYAVYLFCISAKYFLLYRPGVLSSSPILIS